MELITPYSDEKMIYNQESHQYRLTLGYVFNKLGVNLAERVNTAPSDDPQKVADIICKAMLEQLSYELVSGAISMFSGINVKTGQIMDRKKMQEAIIGFNAQKELDKIVPELGWALTYQGQIMTPIGMNIRGDY